MIGLLTKTMAEAASPQGIAALGLDPWGFLAQAVTFLVLLWCIKKFALTKIVAVLEERRKTIDQGVRLGLEMQKEKVALDEKVEELLHKARQEADSILADSHEEARAIIHQAEEAASQKASIMLNEAHSQLAEDVKRARAALKQETVTLVGQATSILLAEKLDAKKDAHIIERALEEARS